MSASTSSAACATSRTAGRRRFLADPMPGDYGEYFTIANLPQSTPTLSSTLIFFGDPSAQDGGASGVAVPDQSLGLRRPADDVPERGLLRESRSVSRPLPSPPLLAPRAVTRHTFGAGALAPSITVTPTDATGNTLTSVPARHADRAEGRPGGAAGQHVRQSRRQPPPGHAAGAERVGHPAAGFTINPGAAATLQTCSDAAFGQGTTAPACPNVAPVGTVSITSPALARLGGPRLSPHARLA